ncbi:MAG: transposase, partial [Sciscionella sp.]
MTDLFGVASRDLLARVELPSCYRARIDSLCRLMEAIDFEIGIFTGVVRSRLRCDPGYTALQIIRGIGPTLATVFVAEIGDIHRFASPDKLCLLGRADSETSRVRHPRPLRSHQQAGLTAGALSRGRVGADPAKTTSIGRGQTLQGRGLDSSPPEKGTCGQLVLAVSSPLVDMRYITYQDVYT